ncbi:unnamed protein product (macronuclear) [Paramecium tetraurelia]|uniref:non-specific serine/threonine protein kinase n=1 Tax=Paramecium tetraurelia TaxID=5888 RepID=A0BNY9_PARTE|nr:uncharacterized protein GSPATT00030895001 [Paramecium tetraurelia]CAK60256.1 unnamed protein product [Paramecium tetraurelia]|eukprot:XP_001427654.1 hypothetical protein (macronuclear) [Paramecium tetraurelia strain d4-2]
MSQSTAKNLRDLLIKQQLNSKIKFKGEPVNKIQPNRKQSGNWDKKVDISQCSCNQKNCTICMKKRVVINASPLLKVKVATKNQACDQDSRREIKVTSSVSAHQSPNREKQYQMQQMFLQKQLQSHLQQLQESRPQSRQAPKEQSKKPQFYHNMENFLNNYYQKGNLSNSQLYENSYNVKSKVIPKRIESKSHVLSNTQTSFKLKLNQQGPKFSAIINSGLVESAPNSPNNHENSTKSKITPNDSISKSKINQNDSKSSEIRRKSTGEISEKTQILGLKIDEQVGRLHFKFLYVIGKGGFGRVWRVEMKKNKKLFALKEMSKAKVIQKRSVNSVLNEKYLLEHLHHPFLVNMWYAFQDRENLFLIIDLLTGGDLRFHLGKMRRFSEAQAKFFVACILLALTYLHQNGIIHRDLKPENLVLDEDGYMRLTDLGIARMNKGNNAGDTSGTPGYMAPEVMCRMDHSVVADYYALGVIAYELMLGRRPYNGRTRQDIREQILAKQVQVKKEELPLGWSENSLDFVNQLILRKPERRLGSNGIEEILHHPWLKGYPWDDLLKKKVQALYVPGAVDDNFDFQNQISEETQLNDEQQLENQTLLRRDTVQSLFEGYHYDIELKNIQHQQTQKNHSQRKSQPVSPEKKA